MLELLAADSMRSLPCLCKRANSHHTACECKDQLKPENAKLPSAFTWTSDATPDTKAALSLTLVIRSVLLAIGLIVLLLLNA
jgi:hypothetical protein